nr:MAG TPA: hypothetical protein [Caudoviricetes sp.]
MTMFNFYAKLRLLAKEKIHILFIVLYNNY